MVAVIPTTKGRRFKDLTGEKFGRWTVLSLHEVRKSIPRWVCRCECGVERVVVGANLQIGHSKSCGCYQSDVTAKRNATHNASYSPLYVLWAGIKARCFDPNHVGFKDYGARGITICERWLTGNNDLTGFECFRADMGERPTAKHTVERKDNNAGYSPDNCIWETRKVQSRNQRGNHFVVVDGERMCLVDALAKRGLGIGTFYYRTSHGWSEDRALNEPVNTRHRRKS